MNQNNVRFTLSCPDSEDQRHVSQFQKNIVQRNFCLFALAKKALMHEEKNNKAYHLLSEGCNCQDPCRFDFILNIAIVFVLYFCLLTFSLARADIIWLGNIYVALSDPGYMKFQH